MNTAVQAKGNEKKMHEDGVWRRLAETAMAEEILDPQEQKWEWVCDSSQRAKIRRIDKTGKVVMERRVDSISLALSILGEWKVQIRMCATTELYKDLDLAW